MNQPLVTIITPTYNRPAMFAECAAAVLAQSFTDWTWWVVFNGWEINDGYLRNAVFDDPRVLFMWYPVSDSDRSKFYVPARIINSYYPKVTTPYIYFLADDDLIDPDGLGVLLAATEPTWECDRGQMTRTKDRYDVVYGRCEVQNQQPDGSYQTACWCYPGGDDHGTAPSVMHNLDVGLGTGINPHCLLDGGQVLHSADLWRKATVCSYCDGTGQIVHSPDMSSYCDTCNGTGRGWQLTERNDDAASCDGALLARLAEFARFHYVPHRIVTHRRHKGATHHKPQEVR